MEQNRIRHVALVEDGKLVGVVSERDLFTLQQIGLRAIGSNIRQATTIDEVVQVSGDIRQLAQGMVDQGIGAEQITRFISTLNDMLTARIIDIEFEHVASDGVQWCWMAMGSEGRFEQTLYTDQDNGIIFSHPEGTTAEDTRQQFLPVAQRINQHLAQCGFSLCKGEIMAGNPQWCLSLEEWKNRFATWIHRGSAPELLNATIFFDFRALHGAEHLVEELRDSLDGLVKANRLFLKKMAENALGNRPPLGFFRDFTVQSVDGDEPPSIDLKVNGVAIFVDAARIFGLSAQVHETSTVRRFAQVCRQDGSRAGADRGLDRRAPLHPATAAAPAPEADPARRPELEPHQPVQPQSPRPSVPERGAETGQGCPGVPREVLPILTNSRRWCTAPVAPSETQNRLHLRGNPYGF